MLEEYLCAVSEGVFWAGDAGAGGPERRTVAMSIARTTVLWEYVCVCVCVRRCIYICDLGAGGPGRRTVAMLIARTIVI